MDRIPTTGILPGLDAIGAYHLLRPLAQGGMARIWLAVDERDGREVAVKRILGPIAGDPELRDAFEDEGALGLRLSHPNIVHTLEVGKAETATGPEPYLVLELLRGRTLIDVLRNAATKGRDIPLSVAVRTVIDAARGLEHAHTLRGDDGRPLQLVHRDVTPHNLFVCTSGAVKVLDFGIATARTQRHQTRAGIMKGKFAYLAPEIIRGKHRGARPDARVDVFALGIVLYELLIGRPLFRGESEAETLHRVLHDEIIPPERLRKDVPPGLGAIALRALQRDPDRRLPSAGAFADSLEAIAAAERIPARPSEVRDFVAELFPHDAAEHATDHALAQRTYAHLSSSSLRALDANPWLTPPGGVDHGGVTNIRTPRPRRAHLALLIAAAVLVTALAAGATTYWLARRPAPSAAPVDPPTLPTRK